MYRRFNHQNSKKEKQHEDTGQNSEYYACKSFEIVVVIIKRKRRRDLYIHIKGTAAAPVGRSNSNSNST